MSFRQHFPSPVTIGLRTAARPLWWLSWGLLAACAQPPKPSTAPPPPADHEGPAEAEGSAPQSDAAKPFLHLDLSELEAKVDSDPNRVLVELDKALDRFDLETLPDADFHLLYARASMALHDQRLAAGRLDQALAQSLCMDADTNAEVALKQGADAREALRLRVQAGLNFPGDFPAMWPAAAALQDRLAELDPSADPTVPADLLLVGRAALKETTLRLQAEEPIPAAARHGATALAQAADAGEVAAYLPLSDLAAWQGMTAEAIAAAQQGLSRDPEQQDLYGRLRTLGDQDRAAQVAALQAVTSAQPGSATAHWYLGEAHYLRGREARSAADTLLAASSWDQAEYEFQQAMSLREDYRDSCLTWLHLVRTQRGWTLRDEGRLDDAAACLLATLREDPQRLEPTSSPESLHLAIDAVVADFYRAQDLKRARAFLRQVCAIYDDEGNWCNNLGFFCRDLGVAAQEAGDEAAARELFEESWEAYSRAVELLPEDARIVNDRALIAVYYLDEHWDEAEQELHRAIALGTAALAEMPADVPAEERQYVDMAVGDAWENLAYLSLVRRGEIGDAEHQLNESVKHFPFAERTGVQRLRTILDQLRQENP